MVVVGHPLRAQVISHQSNTTLAAPFSRSSTGIVSVSSREKKRNANRCVNNSATLIMLQSQKYEYLCWRSCLRANSLAFNTCRVNRLIFTKWTEFKCHRGEYRLLQHKTGCREHSISDLTNYSKGPTFECVAETEFIKANTAEKDNITSSRALKFATLLQPTPSRQADCRGPAP